MTALIFDCDGVLLDNMHLHIEVEVSALQQMGFRIDAETLLERFAGVSQRDVLSTLASEQSVALEPDSDFDRVKCELFAGRVTAMPGMMDALSTLRLRHPICVASGSSLRLVASSLAETGLLDFFDNNIFTSEMVAHGKPAPDLFQFAARQIGAGSSECIVIEDSVAGVTAARLAGMASIGFVGGAHCKPPAAQRLWEAGARHVLADISKLPEMIEETAVSLGLGGLVPG